ncbi:hypothetical protein [Nonomuraea dietziae]|uniref:hypothetical protein n=1 Tax=Nonomuraea dietziae TaxID=65515 RepID=UPI0031CE8979
MSRLGDIAEQVRRDRGRGRHVGALPWRMSGRDPALSLLRAARPSRETTAEALAAIRADTWGWTLGRCRAYWRWLSGLPRRRRGRLSGCRGRPVLPGIASGLGVSLHLMAAAHGGRGSGGRRAVRATALRAARGHAHLADTAASARCSAAVSREFCSPPCPDRGRRLAWTASAVRLAGTHAT